MPNVSTDADAPIPELSLMEGGAAYRALHRTLRVKISDPTRRHPNRNHSRAGYLGSPSRVLCYACLFEEQSMSGDGLMVYRNPTSHTFAGPANHIQNALRAVAANKKSVPSNEGAPKLAELIDIAEDKRKQRPNISERKLAEYLADQMGYRGRGNVQALVASRARITKSRNQLGLHK